MDMNEIGKVWKLKFDTPSVWIQFIDTESETTQSLFHLEILFFNFFITLNISERSSMLYCTV